MKRLLVLPLTLALVVGSVPLGGAQEEDEPPCIHPPDLAESYEWAYNMTNGDTRFVEVIKADRPATTPQGHQNITTLGFEVQDAAGERKSWGRQVRYSTNSSHPWGLASQDMWVQAEGDQTRRMDGFNPPFQIIHFWEETCPGRFWRFTTHHSISYGKYGQAKQESANETWQVRAGQWENLTVPAGTFEVLPVTAVRTADRYEITTYWSPEARAPAKVVQGTGGTPESTQELSWYILDQRPEPLFEVTPLHPQVGDTITLNATASYDHEGPITRYRWLVNDRTYNGSIVRFNATEETTLNIRLFVTDTANRTSTLGTSRYVAPPEGAGVGVTGPDEALRGQIVTLEAHPSFDPVEIRWRDGSTVVAKGDTYRFYMNETTTLRVDAFHDSGRVYTGNHTVQLVTRGEDNGSQDRSRPSTYPPGGSSELAILNPLEGQLVPQRFDVRVQAKGQATLFADERPVWQGTADPGTRVPVHLEPGTHTLRLASDSAEQTVNVTVSQDALADPGTDGERGDDSGANASSNTTAPTPSLPALAVVATLLAIGWVAGRRK